MTVNHDMYRNLKELTEIINNFNKIIKNLSKMYREKMSKRKYDKTIIKELLKKQTMLHEAYQKYTNLVEQVSPNDIIPIPLSPESSTSSSSSSNVELSIENRRRRTRRRSRRNNSSMRNPNANYGGRKTRRQRK